jgi:hypothetical protein
MEVQQRHENDETAFQEAQDEGEEQPTEQPTQLMKGAVAG